MKIELSPGEWAGVLACLTNTVEDMRHDVAVEPIDDVETSDLREQADDLDRVAGIIRAALADDGEASRT